MLNWDLSQSHELQNINRTSSGAIEFHYAKQSPEYLHKEGNFDLTMKLSENRIFHEQIKNIFCTRNGETVEALYLETPPKTLDEAYADGQRLIAYWEFDRRNLDAWYRLNKAGKENDSYDVIKYEDNQNFIYPSLRLKIYCVPPTDSKDASFCIESFGVSWLKP